MSVLTNGHLPPAGVVEMPQTGDGVAQRAAEGDTQALIPNRSTETPSPLPVWVIVILLGVFLLFILGGL